MYEDIIAMFCPTCLNKKVNSEDSVEDYIRMCLRYGEENDPFKGYLILQGALATLEAEGGCTSCISLLQKVSNKLTQVSDVGQQPMIAEEAAFSQPTNLVTFSQTDCNEIFRDLESHLLELDSMPTEQKNELPELIRIGNYKGKNAKIPVLLPFDTMNGFCFETNEQTRDNALRQMQYIALNLLKQVSPNVLHLTFVDIGLNTNFPILHSLNASNLKFVTDRDNLKRAIVSLSETVRHISTKCVRDEYTDLKDYNSHAEYKEPYNVLFIANFPKEFREEEIDAVSTLINEGAKCGIQVIMNLDKAFFPENDNYNKKRFAKLYAIPEQMPYLDCTRIKAVLSNFDNQVIRNFFAKYDFEFETYSREDIKSLATALNNSHEKQDDIPENFLSIFIGKSGQENVYFEMGEKADVYHGMIAGATRTGKSTLLNNIITSIADRYSPDELRLYLLDYKGGVEFQIYENHPNVDVLLLDSNNFAVGIESLTQFRDEIKERQKKFRELKVPNINLYNKKATEKLPRMLMIIDEVQQLFTKDYQSKREVNALVKDIVKLGGGFGIHLLFSSQTYAECDIANDILSQMKLRISYGLANGSDCRAILGSDNDAPLSLKKFHLVYNTHFGRKDKNIVVAADNFKMEKVFELLEKAHNKYQDRKPKIFDGSDETDEPIKFDTIKEKDFDELKDLV